MKTIKPNFETLESLIIHILEIKGKKSFPLEIKLDVKELSYNSKPYYEIKSQDIKEYVGLLGNNMEYVKVENYNGGYSKDNKYYFMPLVLRYKELGGGSNSLHFYNLRYDIECNAWLGL